MKWFKDVVVDVLVTVCIVLAVWEDFEWAKWIVWIYTPFILLLKIGAYFGPTMRVKGKKVVTVPNAVFHVLYAINVLMLLAAKWWLVAAGWAAVWLVSFLAEQKR